MIDVFFWWSTREESKKRTKGELKYGLWLTYIWIKIYQNQTQILSMTLLVANSLTRIGYSVSRVCVFFFFA